MIQQVAVLAGQGASLPASFTSKDGAVAHVHYYGLKQEPTGADHSAPKNFGIPSFVIGYSGNNVWEVGRIDGLYVYRKISGESYGPWRDYDGM